MRVSEHNKKLLKENVELREDSKKLQKIMQAKGAETVENILRKNRGDMDIDLS